MRGWQSAIMSQDVDAMWEADAAAEWERINAPDPCEAQLKLAAKAMTEAAHFMDVAEDHLYDAAADLYETPMEAKVGSFLDQLQDLRIALQLLAETYGKGHRE